MQIKNLEKQIESFHNGSAYINLRKEYERLIATKNREIEMLKKARDDEHINGIKIRHIWMDFCEYQVREHERAQYKLLKEIERLERLIRELTRQRDEAIEGRREKIREWYDISAQLEEEKEKNKKLTAQINRDFENSSIPSSMKIGRKKIPNSREKTDRKPGGQPGHKGHPRKWHKATEVKKIETPREYLDEKKYRRTGNIIKKQVIALSISCVVTEYHAEEFIEIKTGHRVCAKFPDGCVNEVSYDGTVKALAFLLTNECNVSHAKTKQLIKEITYGQIDISEGMINNLCREFSKKTKSEQNKIYTELLTTPVMNTDFTNANVNGESAQVLICAAEDRPSKMFIAREKKGHEGIKGTIVDQYNGILVHDHDTTFYKYGNGHQECAQHNMRYIKGSIQNEENLTWSKSMHELFQEMLHYRNTISNGILDARQVANFERRYDEIIKIAEKEYEYNPPSKYYREGYNLYLRLKKYRENELLFLHDIRVPTNNSICERLARVYKRKQKQAIVMRSFDHLEYLCKCLSVLYSLRAESKNMYDQVTTIFNRNPILS